MVLRGVERAGLSGLLGRLGHERVLHALRQYRRRSDLGDPQRSRGRTSGDRSLTCPGIPAALQERE